MSDYIKREDALKERFWNVGAQRFFVNADDIQALPAAPVREVVTCGECERWKEVETGMGVCISGTCEACVTSADFFCDDGKRADMRGEEGGRT